MRRLPCRAPRWLPLLAALWLAGSSGAASAQASAHEPTWYGWQNLAVDGASLALIGAGAGIDSIDGRPRVLPGLLIGGGVVSLLVASPIVHWIHGNTGLGFGSLGLRAAAGLLGLVGAASHAVTCGDREAEGLSCDAGEGWLVGGVFVGIVAVALDAGLGTEARPGAPKAGAPQPSVTLAEGGATLGVRGAF